MEKDYYFICADTYNGVRINDFMVFNNIEDYWKEVDSFNPENYACKSVVILVGFWGSKKGALDLASQMNWNN